MTDITTITAGIDTSKAKLDVVVHGTTIGFTEGNDKAGWKRIAAALGEAGVGRVGIEATGGYERGVVRHLRANGFAVAVLQPLQTKAFARLHLRRAKNDRIDAALIAACTQAIDPHAVEPDQRLAPLADHLTYVEQVEEDIARIKTRLEHIHDARLRGIAFDDIANFKRRRKQELQHIEQALRAHDDLARRFELVLSIPSIGKRTALALVVLMPELGLISREEAAALAGLAPFDDDSGLHNGQRHIAGGRSRLRRSLYAAALPGSFFWNPALIAFRQRLLAKGKTHKLILVACARKLLIFANTVIARGTPWIPEPAST